MGPEAWPFCSRAPLPTITGWASGCSWHSPALHPGLSRGQGCPLPSPCRWVRGEHYRYKFSRPGGRHAAEGKWWIRRRLGPYFPPLSRQDLRGYFTSREWPYPEPE